MESIFRYEKITLLRCECRKRFKVTLLSSRILWLVVDASIRGPICLFNMLSTRSHLFQNTSNYFLQKYYFPQIYFLLSRGEWICRHWAHNKSEAPQKTSIDEDTNSKSREITWSPFFFFCCDFKLKSIDFFQQINPHSSSFQKFRLVGLTNILVNI